MVEELLFLNQFAQIRAIRVKRICENLRNLCLSILRLQHTQFHHAGFHHIISPLDVVIKSN